MLLFLRFILYFDSLNCATRRQQHYGHEIRLELVLPGKRNFTFLHVYTFFFAGFYIRNNLHIPILITYFDTESQTKKKKTTTKSKETSLTYEAGGRTGHHCFFFFFTHNLKIINLSYFESNLCSNR